MCIGVLVQHTLPPCTHTHSALLTMLCWWTSRGTASREEQLLPSARPKREKSGVLCCHAGDRTKSKHTHKALEEYGVTSLIQPCLWINLSLFLSVTSSCHMCNLCSLAVDSNNACFFQMRVQWEEKNNRKMVERKETERGKKRTVFVGWLWCSYFSSQLQTKEYPVVKDEFVIV